MMSNMMSAFALILIGITIMAGLSHLIIGIRKNWDRIHIYFSLLCFFAIAAIASRIFPGSESSRMLSEKVFAAGAVLTFIWFVSYYAGMIRKKLFAGINILIIVLLVIDIFAQILPDNLREDGMISQELHDDIFMIILISLSFIYLLISAYLQYKRGDRKMAVLLASTIPLALVGVVFRIITKYGYLDFSIPMFISLFGVIVMMSIWISDQYLMGVHKIRESESKYRTLFEKASNALFLMKDDRFVLCNSKTLELFGCTREEILSKTPYDFSPDVQTDGKDTGEQIQRHLSIALSGIVQTFEWTHKRLDGTIFEAEVSVSRVDWSDETNLLAVVRDTTSKKKAERELKQSEKKYRLLIENLLSGYALHEIVVNDQDEPVDYIFLEVNKAFEIITGKEREMIIGRKVTEVFPGIEKSEFDWIAKYGEVALKGEEIKIEQYWEQLDKWFAITVQCPEIGKFVTILEDITARIIAENAVKESEEKYRNLVENSVDSIIITQDTLMIFANTTATKLIGYSLEYLIGKPLSEFLAPEEIPKFKAEFELPRAGKDISGKHETILIHKDGTRKYIEANVTMVTFKGRPATFSSIRDVTDRKKMEDELRTSEERFKLVIEATSVVIWEWDFETDELYFSPIYYKMLGYTPPELPENYATWRSQLHPDDIEDSMRSIEQHIAGGGGLYESEYRFKTKSGNWKWINSRSRIVEWRNEKPKRIVGTMVDIDDRKRAENDLKLSEEKFSKAFYSSSDSIVISDVQSGEIIEVNGGFENTFGYTRLEIIGKTGFELNLWIEKGHREEIFSILKEKGSIRGFHLNMRNKSGMTIDLELNAELIEIDNKKYLLSTVRDITDSLLAEKKIKESEKRFKNIFDESPIGIELYDVDGILNDVNKSCLEIFGVRESANLGKFDLFEDPNISEYQKEKLKDGELIRFESEFDFDDERTLRGYKTSKFGKGYLDIVMTPLMHENELRGYLSQIQDITDNMLLQKRLIQSEKNAAIGELSRKVAHEIGNPLSSIRISVEMLKKYLDLEADDNRLLEVIISESDRLDGIITDFLRFGRMKELELKETDINDLVKDILTLLKNNDRYLKKKIEIRPALLEDDPFIELDKDMIKEVLWNLLLNSVDAIEDTGIIDLILKRMEEHGNKFLEIHVKDSGVGIGESMLNDVFDPFFTTKTGGSGLGLSIIQKIITEHGGSVTVSSVPGDGADFKIKLPFRR
ncbi:MAG: PAS domain S-box protein [bacterium]|nr:PAS domain S-box protein [bacterium]